MKRLTVDEIEPIEVYAKQRDAARKEALARRERRRLNLGDRISLSFENRDTVRYQIQEMCRAESLHRPEQIAHEVDTYNDLIPGPDELSATLMIELTNPDRIQAELDALIGLDRPGVVTMRAGDHTVPIEWEPGHSEENRIAAVQYVKFKLPLEARQAVNEGATIRVVVAHPRYSAIATLGSELREELVSDLQS